MSNLVKKFANMKIKPSPTSTGISNVPSEILGEIFLLVLTKYMYNAEAWKRDFQGAFPSTGTPPMVFLFVNRAWRVAAMTTPQLWRHLVLDHPRAGAVMRSARREAKALSMYAELSGAPGLQLIMVRRLHTDFLMHRDSYTRDPREKDARMALGAELEMALGKCVNVDVAGNIKVLKRVLNGLLEAQGPLKRLIVRTVDGLYVSSQNMAVQTKCFIKKEFLYQLTEFRALAAVSGHATTRPVFVAVECPDAPCNNLKALQLKKINPLTPNRVTDLLGWCRNVQTVEIAMTLHPPNERLTPGKPPYFGELKALTSLTLSLTVNLLDGLPALHNNAQATQVYSPISFPALEFLTLNLALHLPRQQFIMELHLINELERPLLDVHVQRSSPMLSIIYNTFLRDSIDLRKLAINGIDATPKTDVRTFLNCFPKVEELAISGLSNCVNAVVGLLSAHACDGSRNTVLFPRLRTLYIRGFSWTREDQMALRDMAVARWCQNCRTYQERAHVQVRSMRSLVISPSFAFQQARAPKNRPLEFLLNSKDKYFAAVKAAGLELCEVDKDAN